MLVTTQQTKEGLPVFQAASISAWFPVPEALTPMFCDGKQVGFLREQGTTTPREKVAVTFNSYRRRFELVSGFRWTGD